MRRAHLAVRTRISGDVFASAAPRGVVLVAASMLEDSCGAESLNKSVNRGLSTTVCGDLPRWKLSAGLMVLAMLLREGVAPASAATSAEKGLPASGTHAAAGSSSPDAPRAKGAPSAASGAAAAAASGAGSSGAAAAPSLPSASVTVDPARARVGDRIRLTASLEEAGEWKAVPAESLKAGETLGPFRILTIDTSSPRTLVLLLSPEDLGSLEIPSFDLAFRGPGGEEKKLVVPASHVTVASIIGEGDSTALSDLKPPAELPIPWPWRTIGLVAVLAAALAAAVYGAARWFARPRAATPMPEEALPPGMTPDVWARGELARILASGLREAGRYRELHIELADLARRYIELRFRIPALERTTSEIGYEMRLALIEEEVTLLTTALLARCDRVKFAKYVPQGAEVDETVELAGRIIERTVAHETLSPPAGSVSSEPAGTPAVGPA